MATGVVLRRAVGNKLKNIARRGRQCSPSCSFSVQAQQNEDFQVQYPPVKPQYPPGSWGAISPTAAWELHERACELNDIPKAKERLERMAGQRLLPSWKVRSLDAFPGTITYKQHITRTHIIDEMPSLIGSPELTDRVVAFSDQLKPLLIDLLLQEHESHIKIKTRGGDSAQYPNTERHTKIYPGHVLLGQILNCFYANLALKHDYLLRSQLDENVRMECFWFRGGYEKKVTMKSDRYRFQTANIASYQVRTELPLPEFVPLDDPLCEGEVPVFPYHPKTIFQKYYWERPISVSGHWIEDPCEFHSTSFYLLDHSYLNFIQQYGDELAQDETKAFALVAGFASAASQAHNQGFNWLQEVTYPFTSQVVVTDGRMFRFAAYQLNTLQMWKDLEGNPRRNLMWTSEVAPLYDVIEGGQVKGFNDDVLTSLLRCMLLSPVDRGVELRPYLPKEETPSKTRLFINHVGGKPLPSEEIGRFQYPVNAVYF